MIELNGKEYLKYSDCVRNRSLLLRYVDVHKWQYKEDMIYFIDYLHQNEYIVLKEWDDTDLSSTPCFGECLIPREKYLIACLHDALYRNHETYIYVKDKNNLSPRMEELQKYWDWIDEHTFKPNRKFADLVYFYWLCEEKRVIYWEKNMIPPFMAYFILRIVGRWTYWS